MTIMINEVNPSLDEALEHYGVKGMKWGVRKNSSGSRKKMSSSTKKQIMAATLVAGAAAAAAIIGVRGSRKAGTLRIIDQSNVTDELASAFTKYTEIKVGADFVGNSFGPSTTAAWARAPIRMLQDA